MIKNRLETPKPSNNGKYENQMLQLGRNDNEQAARLTLSTTTGNILLKDNDN